MVRPLRPHQNGVPTKVCKYGGRAVLQASGNEGANSARLYSRTHDGRTSVNLWQYGERITHIIVFVCM
jgi:hypothetical protein